MNKTDREFLIMSNLPLVYFLAKKMCRNSEEIMDLVSIGTIGLIKAVDNKDPKFNQKQWQGYMQQNITGEILNKFKADRNIMRVEAGFLLDFPSLADALVKDHGNNDGFYDIISNLSEKDKALLTDVFVYNKSMAEISRQRGVTRQLMSLDMKRILLVLKNEIGE